MAQSTPSDEQVHTRSESSSDFSMRKKSLERFVRDVDGMRIVTRFDRNLLRGLLLAQVPSEEEFVLD